MAEPDTLRLAKQVYRLRTLGLGIGVLPIMAVLHERAPPVAV